MAIGSISRSFVFSTAIFSLFACSSSEHPLLESAAELPSAMTVRVHPDGGRAAIELVQPDWAMPRFQYQGYSVRLFSADLGALRFGLPLDVTSALASGPNGTVQVSASKSAPPLLVKVERGLISRVMPSGVMVRWEKAIDSGIMFSQEDSSGFGERMHHWSLNLAIRPTEWVVFTKSRSSLESILTFGGKYKLTGPYDGDSEPVDLVDGQLIEFTHPVATVRTEFDPISPDFPGEGPCNELFIVNAERARAVPNGPRPESGVRLVHVPNRRGGGPVVVPAGRLVALSNACSADLMPLPRGASVTMKYHRLEVDDLEITDANRSVRKVRGTFSVSSFAGQFWPLYEKSWPTHTGMDLPSGKYRVVSRAEGIEHSVDVTLQ